MSHHAGWVVQAVVSAWEAESSRASQRDRAEVQGGPYSYILKLERFYALF